MANALFRRHFAGYASVHRDARNKATHFVGIPVIVFSLQLVLAPYDIGLAGVQWPLALVFSVLAVAGWAALDLGIGAILGLLVLAGWYAAEALATVLGSPGAVWTAFLVLFVGGWAVQFLGHHYEGKRPALMDNVFQGFIGPMFLVGETLVALGKRADLAELMGNHPVTAR
ncbi:MAG: DUF962 domain-containing protein [Reyranella sp.]|nr:DUF962 domain-containing protein [Reyranella sp.]